MVTMSVKHYEASTEFIDYLDAVLHKITNNQQAAMGHCELISAREGLDPETRKEIDLIFRVISENSKLVLQMKDNIKDMRRF